MSMNLTDYNEIQELLPPEGYYSTDQKIQIDAHYQEDQAEILSFTYRGKMSHKQC